MKISNSRSSQSDGVEIRVRAYTLTYLFTHILHYQLTALPPPPLPFPLDINFSLLFHLSYLRDATISDHCPGREE